MENQTAPSTTVTLGSQNVGVTYSETLQKMIDKREELFLARDILALQLEIKELKQALDGNTNSKES